MKPTKLFTEFFESEKAGGLILVLVTGISLFLANSAWQASYVQFWHYDVGGHSLADWVNDGLMTIFFLLIGLELEREIIKGELSGIKNASFPFLGALGGMIVPAGIFLVFNWGADTQQGAGIPMATDIAFAIGILSLLGNRVPPSLKIFLTALAVIDDLGAILIIAFFYTASLSYPDLFMALGTWVILFILNRLKVNNLLPYLAGGTAMWYFMLHSGIHATVTGVLLAFAIPFGDGEQRSPSYTLQHFLHKPVAFIILPLFAMANTCLTLDGKGLSGLGSVAGLGIVIGLLLGKPIGIWLFTFIGVRTGLCALPAGLKWNNIIGAGILGGIGFTMSIFIALLAFNSEGQVNLAKIAILIASLIAGITGILWLKLTLTTPAAQSPGDEEPA